MTSFGKIGSQGNQLLPTERVFFNYGNDNNISGYNSFFGGKSVGGGTVSENKLVLNNDNSKLLFAGGFDVGLDTLNEFNCYFSGALLPEGRNTEATVGNDQITHNAPTSSVNIKVDAATSTGSTYILESKNYLKLSTAGRTFLECQGVFEHVGDALGNTTTFRFQFDGSSFSQDIWNIDTFGAGQKNPSNITLDFKKVQTVVFEFNNKSQGDVLCGFLVKNTIYYAHRFEVNNAKDNTELLNLPFRDEIAKTDSVTILRSIGLFNDSDGVLFESVMDITVSPSIVLNQYINSVVCFAIGSTNLSKRIPFAAGNKAAYKTVTVANTPLFSLQSKPIYIADPNRTVFNMDQLQVHASGVNQNHGCFVKILYNSILSGGSPFVDLPDSDSGLEYDTSATSISGGIEIFSMPIYANQIYTFSYKDIEHAYKRYFSRTSIIGVALSAQVLQQTITVVATPMAGVATLNVSANIVGGEIG